MNGIATQSQTAREIWNLDQRSPHFFASNFWSRTTPACGVVLHKVKHKGPTGEKPVGPKKSVRVAARAESVAAIRLPHVVITLLSKPLDCKGTNDAISRTSFGKSGALNS
jgi:hypothetical protein